MRMRVICFAVLTSIYITPVLAQQDFTKGELSPTTHHVGNVWLNELNKPDTTINLGIAYATFAADARLDWHSHPGGQILMFTEGSGYYQERGKPKKLVQKGDVVKCLPNVEHWHGATPQHGVSYLAASPAHKGKTIWLEPVTTADYYSEVHLPGLDKELLIQLSRNKWRWMQEFNTDSLAQLFHDEVIFVHMGATFGKQQELDVISNKGIVYKNAEIQDVSVRFVGNTGVLLNKIVLTAVVGGKEVVNPFNVTEIYVTENGNWKLASLSFTRLVTPN